MPCATSQVSATLIGHSSSSGASIQSRISPNSERCSRRNGLRPRGRSPRRRSCVDRASGRAGAASRHGVGPAAAAGGSAAGSRIFQAVAEAAHGGDADRALLDLLAQAVDVDLDRVVADLLAPFAQALDQLVLADQAARRAAAALRAGPARAPTARSSGRRCRPRGRSGRSVSGPCLMTLEAVPRPRRVSARTRASSSCSENGLAM